MLARSAHRSSSQAYPANCSNTVVCVLCTHFRLSHSTSERIHHCQSAAHPESHPDCKKSRPAGLLCFSRCPSPHPFPSTCSALFSFSFSAILNSRKEVFSWIFVQNRWIALCIIALRRCTHICCLFPMALCGMCATAVSNVRIVLRAILV